MKRQYSQENIIEAINSIDEFILIKGKKSKLLWANKAFLDYYGMSEEEIYNIIDSDASDPDDTLQYIKDDNYVFSSGQKLNIENEPVTNHNGVVNYFETNKYPIICKDNENDTNEIICISRKIENDQLIEMSKEERSSRKDFLFFQKKFFSQVKAPILFLDAQSRVISVSETFTNLFNIEQTDVLGLYAKDFISLQRFPSQGESLEVEIAKVKLNRIELNGFISISPWYFSENEAGGHLLFFNDQSKEIKLKEELQEQRKQSVLSDRHKSLGEMSAGVGHEINNPLAIILGTLDKINILYKDKLFDELEEDLDSIKKNSLRISAIVKGLKNLSRDSSQDDYVLASIKDIVEDSLSLCQGRASYLGISILKEIENNFSLSCRPAEIAQVIYNLVSNSIDEIANQKQPWIQIRVHRVESTSTNCISLIDSGSGIPDDIANQIFNPFFTTKDVGQGTGLGLGISKQIMIQHGGDLELNTQSSNTHFIVKFKDVEDENLNR